MIDKFYAKKIVLATHNPGKLSEMQDLLAPKNINVISAGSLNLPEPAETGTTFEENAALKARAAATASGLPALADDSGLAITALNGAPGVYSARWGGPEADFQKAMQRIEDELNASGATKPIDRHAAFICVMALALPDGTVEMRRGACDGTIIWPPQGEGGFGYDAIFAPKGESRSFAQMSKSEKQALSHRGKAMRAMLDEVFV